MLVSVPLLRVGGTWMDAFVRVFEFKHLQESGRET